MDHSHHDMHDMHNMHNMNMNESDGMSHDHSGHHDHSAHDHSAHDHGSSMDTTTMVSSAMNMVMNHTVHAAASSHGSHGGSMHGGGMHGMSMSFHGGFTETILFDCWKISTVSGLIGSMIGIMIMAALYEGLKYYREYLFWKTYNSLQYRSVSMPRQKNVVAEDNRVVQMVGEVIHKQPPTMLSWMHTFQTLLHIIQIVLSYFLMLIFMTFNYWLGLAVVLGGAIGYFLFGWKKSVIVDVTEHCH
ncbi:high affinity copper uptake protein 1 isoform X1 [Aphidius gifuensis]|uniref:high affinity copper uptake protein 1 isoform X1 n=1 Tax=Aphidius gifuensis TaxID=684658 RepID=UPI001CDBFF4D|nr:high affinity copper uptake protein 1 isoform X1 [Aphidius gifuensis]